MAGDWIPMRVDLADDPAVIYMARRLKLDEDAVVGKLYRVWVWAQSASPNGVIDGADARAVDKVANRKGFAAAMAATPVAPWLIIRDDGLTVPHFDRWLGGAAKRRLQEAQWKREQRDRGPDPHSRLSPRAVDRRPDNVHPESGHSADDLLTKGKDRTGEKEKNNPLPPSGAGSTRRKKQPYAPKHPDTPRLIAHLADRWPTIQPDGIPPKPTDANLAAADNLAARFGGTAVAALIDFYAERYRPDAKFDWREKLTGMTYLKAKWVQLDGERRRQLGLGAPVPAGGGPRSAADIAAGTNGLLPTGRERAGGITS